MDNGTRKFTLDQLLSQPEGQYFDRKSATIKPSKLAETIVAFANADGGTIAIGIRDKKIEGINSQENVKINDFIQCGFDNCKPSVKYDYEFFDVTKENGKNDRILLLYIDASTDYVHATNADKVFLRVGDESRELNFEQRKSLEYDKGTRSYEDTVIEECTIKDLCLQAIKEYTDAIGYKGDDIEKSLFARGFGKRTPEGLKLNAAGVLMFCDFPAAFVPSAKVRFFRYEGTHAETGTRMNIVKQETIEGHMTKVIEEVKILVENQLREFTALNSSSGKFITVPEYPPFAWQEGIVNAVTHRAYNIHGDDIKINMYDDRLEISSPGKFPSIVNVKNIKNVRYSRNPKIARALTEIGWVRELGEGVNRIYDEMKRFFLDEPIYIESEQSVHLVLKNNIVMRKIRRQEHLDSQIVESWANLTANEKTALEVAYGKGKIKTLELAEIIGVTRGPAKRVLDQLVEKDLMEKISSSDNDPNLHYIINYKS